MPGPLIVSISGKKLLERERILLADPKVGGLVLFRENYDEAAEDPKQDLKDLIAEIRFINPTIVIMVDHEGGRVWRFTKGFTKLPKAKEYGSLYDKDKGAALQKAFADGRTMARELLECGIDMSLAPVVDLDGDSNVIGGFSRAYHRDPAVVAEIAGAFISGMNRAGMLATLKHFPGHGTCKLDSHVALPIDDRSLDELQADLQPFKALIANCPEGIAAVMSNFVLYPQVDATHVAAFSEVWLKAHLRSECVFTGVIMSDCLHMKGADVGTNLARLEAAGRAGNDFLMYTHQHDANLEALIAILPQIPDSAEAAMRRVRLASAITTMRRSGSVMMPPSVDTGTVLGSAPLAAVARDLVPALTFSSTASPGSFVKTDGECGAVPAPDPDGSSTEKPPSYSVI
jgi:beta-N-acetylhexosaminidase